MPTPLLDPTQNVRELVAAQERSRDALRDADVRYAEIESRRQDDLSKAETQRINELRALDARYAVIMEKMRDDKIDSTAKLLADQLREIKNDIQVELRSLNQFRWETGGKATGGSLLFYIIVQVVMSIAGIGTIIGVMYAIFKPH